jgi:hypothetical protein
VDVRFVTSDLRQFNSVRTEAILLPLFAGERPLRGVVGLVDWRLSGKLCSLVRAGRLSGEEGERCLVAGRPKLAVDKLFIYGVGPRETFDEAAFSRSIEGLFATLASARIRSTVWLLPGRETGLITPKRAMELFLSAAGEEPALHHDEVTMVEDHDAQRIMMKVVERTRRQRRAQLLE